MSKKKTKKGGRVLFNRGQREIHFKGEKDVEVFKPNTTLEISGKEADRLCALFPEEIEDFKAPTCADTKELKATLKLAEDRIEELEEALAESQEAAATAEITITDLEETNKVLTELTED